MITAKSTKKVTMKDVALRANVALGTVSRIINENSTVSPELRAHVEGVIQELGYRPNVTARTMRTQRTQAIGIIVTDLRQPVAAGLVAAASEVARRHGFAPIVGDFLNDVAAEETLLRFMSERSVDGILLTTSSDESPELLDRLTELGVPVVLWERDAGNRFSSVRTDHRHGTTQAGVELRKRGRGNVALIAGHEHTWTGREQIVGLQQGLGDAVQLTVVHTGRFDPNWLLAALSGPAPFDGIVANIHDIPQILRIIAATGWSCPEDLSVISIGDDPFLNICNPPISSVRLRPDLVGEMAAHILLRQIDQKIGGMARMSEILTPEFVLRCSV